MTDAPSMLCQLCGHDNPCSSEQCTLCGAQLLLANGRDAVTADPVEAIDVSRTRLSAARVLVTALLLLLAVLPWYMMCDLFQVPKEIAASRESYRRLQNRFSEKKETCLQQKDQVLAVMQAPLTLTEAGANSLKFDKLPLEIFAAYIEDELGIHTDRFPTLAWYPGSDLSRPSFILSKHEGQRWLFPIMLSLEISLQTRGDRVNFEVRRLRRGKRDIAQGLAWIYFGPELQALRHMEELAGGISQFRILERAPSAHIADADPLSLSWNYEPHGLNLSPRRLN